MRPKDKSRQFSITKWKMSTLNLLRYPLWVTIIAARAATVLRSNIAYHYTTEMEEKG
jgi:hypothetical protein